jgi:predicted TIM-barrel fold metal-dependent hydrolase
MRDGYRIFDIDRHVYEPLDLWPHYLERRFAEHAPTLAYVDRGEPLVERMTAEVAGALLPLPPDLVVDGEPVMNVSRTAKIQIAAAAVERPDALLEGQTAAGHLAAMDRDGIDEALLLPTYASYLVAMEHREPGLAAGFAAAYNRWLADLCAEDPRRLRAAALIARFDPEGMIEQAAFAVANGWPAVVVRPNPIAGRSLGDALDAAFWAYCAAEGLTVIVHEGAHARATSAGADRFTSRFALHACSHPMEQMMAYLSLVEGGVMERHPDLRFAFLEAGCGWMVHWLWRLDEVEYVNLADEVAPTMPRRPSDYFRRQCGIGFEPDEPMLAETLDHLGPDRLLFGSDFPHLDHDADITGCVTSLPLGRERLEKLLWHNATALLGVEQTAP